MPPNKIKTPSFLPSIFTSGNLFCGMLAVMEAFRGNSYRGAWLIILAAFFDSTDGMVARLTHQTSRFGVELDSLSDMVSFVLAPVMLIYPLCLMDLNLAGVLAGFAFVVSGAIRLARFNVEQKNLLEKGGIHRPAHPGRRRGRGRVSDILQLSEDRSGRPHPDAVLFSPAGPADGQPGGISAVSKAGVQERTVLSDIQPAGAGHDRTGDTAPAGDLSHIIPVYFIRSDPEAGGQDRQQKKKDTYTQPLRH